MKNFIFFAAQPTKAQSGLQQTCKMDNFANRVNDF